MKRVGIIGCLWLMLMAGTTAVSAKWTLEDALDQIDRATKGVKALAGAAEVTERRKDAQPVSRKGRVSISMEGRARYDLEGEGARTILSIPGKLFEYDPARSLVTEFDVGRHPEKLAPHAIVGFSPCGGDLKKDYLVTLVEEAALDGRSVLLIELTPRSDALRAAISRIQIWIDQANWFPMQQRIFHGGADTHLTVRYSDLSRNDTLDESLFEPKWPKGTRREKADRTG